MGQDPTQLGKARPLLLLEGLFGWLGPQDIAQVCHPFGMSAPILWINLLFWWTLEWLKVGMFFMCRRWAPSFHLPLDFLEGVLAFSLFFLSSSNCDNVFLRVLIDSFEHESYWAAPSGPGLTVQNACPFLQGSLPCMRRLLSLRKSSRPVTPWWQSVPRLLQCPELGHCSQLGISRQFECGYASTLLLVQCQTRQSWLLTIYPYFCLV